MKTNELTRSDPEETEEKNFEHPKPDISNIAYFLSSPKFWTTLLICSDSWRMA